MLLCMLGILSLLVISGSAVSITYVLPLPKTTHSVCCAVSIVSLLSAIGLLLLPAIL